MKAIRLRAPSDLDRLTISEMDEPQRPGGGEILVRLRGSSLNFHDYLVAKGRIPAAEGRVPMSDGAGIVEEVGEGVTEFKAGDHVVSCFFPQWQSGAPVSSGFSATPGDGVDGYARDRVTRPANWFTHAPKGYSSTAAATLTTAGLTAWRALVTDGALKAGETVLVLGTGGVSVFGAQLAKMMGATVIATSSSDEKLERIRSVGVDHTINYKRHAEWSRQVLDLTNGRGVDHVIEVGGPGTLPQSIAACRIGGHIALIGVLTGSSGLVPTAALMGRHQRLQGLIVGSREQQIELVRALDASTLKPVIDRSFPLAQLGDAFRYEESGAHFGKICIEI